MESVLSKPIDTKLLDEIYEAYKSETTHGNKCTDGQTCQHCDLATQVQASQTFILAGGIKATVMLLRGEVDIRDILLLGFYLGIRYAETQKFEEAFNPSGQS